MKNFRKKISKVVKFVLAPLGETGLTIVGFIVFKLNPNKPALVRTILFVLLIYSFLLDQDPRNPNKKDLE